MTYLAVSCSNWNSTITKLQGRVHTHPTCEQELQEMTGPNSVRYIFPVSSGVKFFHAVS